MMTTSTTQSAFNETTIVNAQPENNVAKWLKGGWEIYKKAPVKLTLITMFFMLLPAVFFALPAPYGITFSKCKPAPFRWRSLMLERKRITGR